MTAQVIFLTTFYYPDQEEQARLENYQEYLTFCHAEFDYKYSEKGHEFKRALKEQVHKDARKRLCVVDIKNG